MTSLAKPDAIRDVPLAEALSERYLAYALSTITSRSLPDVRDGLKPVQRRLLYAMRQLGLDPASGFKKCARVVGDVIGKYHPHGDVAVYDAMVRLAQDFAVRYPLVDGQGNFGNVDGDNAAAMRYTEARLTAVAEALLAGIDDNAVDFRPTYDGSESEPLVLPARFPNLLANGATGIAVGMATSVPPHNVGELCAALLHLIKFPNVTAAKLAELVPGPDFPSGGTLAESRQAIVEAYATGRGSFRVRAAWEVEKLDRGQYQIVVSQIPYQVAKGRLVEKIAELLADRKLPLVADIRDESAADVRLILVPKSRTVEPSVLMESLFRHTDLESRVPLNLNVLDAKGVPRVMGLREALQAFLDHRHDVLLRVTEHRLAAIARRLEILAGYLVAYANLDAIIRIIRESDEPKAALMKRFKLTDLQAESILNMRLRALRKLEEIEIRRENDALSAEQKDLKALLRSDDKRWQAIAAEIKDIKSRFGANDPLGRRRTRIGDAPAAIEVPIEAEIEREPVTVVCSDKGWIRAIKGHVAAGEELRYKEGDRGRFVIPCETTDKIIVLATNGRFYALSCDRLPGGRGHGEPIRLMIDLDNDHDLVALRVYRPDERLLVAASDGRGFIVSAADVFAQTRAGKQVLSVSGDVEARVCVPVAGDTIAVLGDNRKLLLMPAAEIPVMSKGRGVILQRYKDGGLADAKSFDLKDGLTWRLGDRVRTETALKDWVGERGQAGRLPPAGFPRANKFT